MKKIATVLILILLIISCNHKNKGLINPQDSDSIIRVEKRNQEIQDSLNQIRTVVKTATVVQLLCMIS